MKKIIFNRTEKQRKRYLFYAVVVTVIVSATFVSCIKNVFQDEKPAWRLTLDKTSAVLAVKNTLTLKAEIYPADATNKEIIWTSDNPSVATVKNGTVSAIADGIVVITATTKDGNCKGNCTILVTSKTIYMAGMVKGKATLWKNGVLQELEDEYNSMYPHIVFSVFVSDNGDVYVAGRVNEDARLWKNGVLQNLEDANGAVAYSVFVFENDVYVAGQKRGGYWNARLWKNGIIQNLEKTDYYEGEAYSVFVSDNNVYVVGETDGAKLWKNGIIQNMEDIGSAYYASVFVSGNDVYVAGSGLWKNGIVQKLIDGNSYTNTRSVFVYENDVYVIGSIGNVLTLWKNGVKQALEGASSCYTSSLFVSDNNVYVGGFRKLWVNGKAFPLDGEFGYVFVK